MNYFEVKVKCFRTQEDGCDKKVTEDYVADAESFTEAEARIIKEVFDTAKSDVEIASIAKTKYSEVMYSDKTEDDKWYKCKISNTIVDENTGKEKKANVYYLIQASSLETARTYILKLMDGTVSDWELNSIIETPVLEVYDFITNLA